MCAGGGVGGVEGRGVWSSTGLFSLQTGPKSGEPWEFDSPTL